MTALASAMRSPWTWLFAAAVFEVAFTTVLRVSTRPGAHWGWQLLFVGCLAGSFGCLERAIRPALDGRPAIPVGTAYAVWTGIGAAGTLLVGLLVFGERATPLRLLLLAVLLAATIGLKLVEH